MKTRNPSDPIQARVEEMARLLQAKVIELINAKGRPFVEFALIVSDRFGPGGFSMMTSSVAGGSSDQVKNVLKLMLALDSTDVAAWPQGETFSGDQLDEATARILNAVGNNKKNKFFCTIALSLAYANFCIDTGTSLERAKEFLDSAWGAVLSTKE